MLVTAGLTLCIFARTDFCLTVPYSAVCGRVVGYQCGQTGAFNTVAGPATIDEYYVDGVTHGRVGAREHIWKSLHNLIQIHLCVPVLVMQILPLWFHPSLEMTTSVNQVHSRIKVAVYFTTNLSGMEMGALRETHAVHSVILHTSPGSSQQAPVTISSYEIV